VCVVSRSIAGDAACGGELSTMPCACVYGVLQGVNVLASATCCLWLVP
jgi:hypothetical protein